MREFSGKGCDTLHERATLILMLIPFHEIYFFEEALNPFRVIWEETLVDVAGIPFKQDIAEIEDDGSYI